MKPNVLLDVQNLHVSVGTKEILQGLTLQVREGEVHALMGPNGSGKSTLAQVIAGNPAYTVTSGSITFKGEDVLTMKIPQRAQKEIFLSFQHPPAVGGVSIKNFLRTAYNSLKTETPLSVLKFSSYLKEKLSLLGLEETFAERHLNEGFSGGEKKKSEMLQLAVLDPTLAILDETDSGLDIDSLKTLSQGVKEIMKTHTKGVLIITHHNRILEYLQPDTVSVVKDGAIVATGTHSLVKTLEKEGFKQF